MQLPFLLIVSRFVTTFLDLCVTVYYVYIMKGVAAGVTSIKRSKIKIHKYFHIVPPKLANNFGILA